MYKEIPGGTYEDIQTLKLHSVTVRCWIPPEPEDKSEILFYDLPKEEQYWRRQPLPDWYEELREVEKAKQAQYDDLSAEERVKAGPRYVNPKLQRYRNQQWLKRMNGVFFMNNGVPTYLTGPCWYYLNWWHGDHPVNDGYPIYYDEIRKRFYFRQYCLEDPACLGYLIIGPRGFGKCLGKGTKVRMYDGGIKNVEDILVGDTLMGDDSSPRVVKKLYRGVDDMFEIVQNQAMSYVVNSQHILSLRRNKGTGARKKGGKIKSEYPLYGSVANVPLYELIAKSKNFFNVFSGYKVGVEYSKKELEIDPYFLGLWLGDGDSSYPSLTTMDDEIMSYCDKYAGEIGMDIGMLDSRNCGKAVRFVLKSRGYRSSPNPLLNHLRDLDLINNKHIPYKYLYSSKEDRLKLLAGIIDTDGYYKSGCYEVVQKRERLAIDIKMLADTLGYKTSVKEKLVNGTVYYRVFISGTADEIPVLLERKRSKTKPNKDHLLTKISEINYLGKGEYFGFEIDGNRLFLLEDGTVTHNTQEETCVMTESITRTPRKRKAVIQSKSEDDAKRVFTEKIRPAYNDLPDFFKPVSNHGTIPDKMLSFYRDFVRGKKAKEVTFRDEDELQNTMIYAPAKEKQLSGQNIAELFNDEIGVTDPKKEADVYVRSQINRFCVYRNGIKVGLNRQTTTVEEMDKGGAECKKIWDESDILNRTGNGFTKSGYYRYMVNDIDASIGFADKHGVIDREKARAFHDAERLARKNDGAALNSYIRKNPRDESEIFVKASNKCHFDAQILTTSLRRIIDLPPHARPYRQGMFEWENNIRNTKVVWMPCTHDEVSFVEDRDTSVRYCPRCRYWINTNTFPDESERNNVVVEMYGNAVRYTPRNQLKWSAGADPYENTFIIDEARGSNAAMHIKRKYDYLIDNGKEMFEEVTNSPALEYIYRPGDVYEMYDDFLKAIWFFGCEILPEANKIGFQKWMQEFYPGFLINRPKGLTAQQVNASTEGLRSSTPIITAYTDAVEYDVKHHGHKYVFPRSIFQAIHFNNLDTTKFDATVSWGFTLLGCEKKIVETPIPPNVVFFKAFDRDGNVIKQ